MQPLASVLSHARKPVSMPAMDRGLRRDDENV